MRWSILILVVLSFSTFLNAKVINVPGDYTTIQAGINASANSDTVLVAEGTYTGTGNKNLDFFGKAITVMSENGVDSTIIDCENDGKGFYFHSNESSNSIVEGFTIRNGSSDYGGGIYCSKSPTIKNCFLTENVAYYGGGIYCGSSPKITNCTITGNTAQYGGGITCGTSSSPNITNCMVTRNNAENGGGISCSYSSFPKILNCIIIGNSAVNSYGGGIYCNYSYAIISNCNITEDTAPLGGGIACFFSHPTISNCIIAENSADFGGGIYFDNYTLTISKCTITGNNASYLGGGIFCFNDCSPTIKNSILWNDITYEIEGNPNVSYSNIEGGWSGEGNINSDPLFVEPENGDFHLLPNSPCIDTGEPSSTVPFGGGCRIDMGAYEFYKGFNCQSEPIPSVSSKNSNWR